jgi:hypothetical protein
MKLVERSLTSRWSGDLKVFHLRLFSPPNHHNFPSLLRPRPLNGCPLLDRHQSLALIENHQPATLSQALKNIYQTTGNAAIVLKLKTLDKISR